MKNYSIVGMEHQGTTEIVAALEPGIAVTLVREPENKFDKNAIAVWIDGRRVGYVPKSQNVALAAHIDQNGIAAIMNGQPIEAAKAILGQDNALVETKIMEAKFIRSPNSSYPMVSV